MESTSSLTIPEPVTQQAKDLKSQLSPGRWESVSREAFRKIEILESVGKRYQRSCSSLRDCLEQVAPDVGWSRYLHWSRAGESRSGPKWERLLDRRVPPSPDRIPEAVRSSTVALRLSNPSISYEHARALLFRQFGEVGNISNTALGKIWREQGLTDNTRRPLSSETVEYFPGGGGLALIGAAACETKAFVGLAKVANDAGKADADSQSAFLAALGQAGHGVMCATAGITSGLAGFLCRWIAVISGFFEGYSSRVDIEDRDGLGRFTAEYNKTARGETSPGQADSRWSSDSTKVFFRDITTLETLNHRTATSAARMLAIGLVPLITEMRGFEGVNTSRGSWLSLAGIHPYKAATLHKSLTELALLRTGEAMWEQHGRQWREITLPWCEDGAAWLRFAFYIDATADPYWTRHYAASGRVTKIGQVRPCLSRICVTGGPGVPLLVETCAGSVSLKNALIPMLARLDKILGERELGRMSIIDAEMATSAILTALCQARRPFITVLKGPGSRNISLEETTDWVPYRDHDRLRAGVVTLKGAGAPVDGLKLRVVQMERTGSRHPTGTIFLHNLDAQWIDTKELIEMQLDEVADAYLSRWPHQEQIFRDTRNGAGFERSHGFGGEFVTHVALETKTEAAERSLKRAEENRDKALVDATQLRALKDKSESKETKAVTSLAFQKAERNARAAEKIVEKARKKAESIKTTPRLIYQRDTTRENIATVLSLTVMMLLEFVLKEYFGGLKIELRTFIEHFVYLPTTVRTSQSKIVYQIEGNPRHQVRTNQLREACAEITRRLLQRDGKLLIFEVVDPPHAGPGKSGQFPRITDF